MSAAKKKLPLEAVIGSKAGDRRGSGRGTETAGREEKKGRYQLRIQSLTGGGNGAGALKISSIGADSLRNRKKKTRERCLNA